MAVRGAKKGESRRKGIPNKSTLEIKEILSANVDFSIVVKKLYELVQGITVKQKGEDGTTEVYEKEPNVPAAKLLLEYGFGKPKEQIDITSGGKRFEFIIGSNQDTDS